MLSHLSIYHKNALFIVTTYVVISNIAIRSHLSQLSFLCLLSSGLSNVYTASRRFLLVPSVWTVAPLEDVLVEEGVSKSLGARETLLRIVLEQPFHQVEYLLQLCGVLPLVILKKKLDLEL